MFPPMPSIPLPPFGAQVSLGLRDRPRDGSFRIALKRKARGDVDHGDHEELDLEASHEWDDVEDEGDRLGGGEEDVGAEAAEADEADHQPGYVALQPWTKGSTL